jgi:hypothetical protein
MATTNSNDGSAVTRDTASVLTIDRPGREAVRGRMRADETHRHAYDRLLELDRLQAAPPVLWEDYSADVSVEADVAGQPVTLRVSVQLRRGAPEVLYATGAEVCGAGEGALLVGDVLPPEAVTDAMLADVEAVLVECWIDLEAT